MDFVPFVLHIFFSRGCRESTLTSECTRKETRVCCSKLGIFMPLLQCNECTSADPMTLTVEIVPSIQIARYRISAKTKKGHG